MPAERTLIQRMLDLAVELDLLTREKGELTLDSAGKDGNPVITQLARDLAWALYDRVADKLDHRIAAHDKEPV